jgi:hypothetical protein
VHSLITTAASPTRVTLRATLPPDAGIGGRRGRLALLVVGLVIAATLSSVGGRLAAPTMKGNQTMATGTYCTNHASKCLTIRPNGG